MKRRWGHLIFGLAFFVVLGQWVSPAVDAAAEPDDGPQKRLRLTVDAPAGPLALGDEAALTIVATNPGAEPVENVQLYLPQGRGVEWLEPADGGWVALGALAAGESRTVAARVRVAGLPRGSRLRFAIGVTGDDAKPGVARVSLLVPRLHEETATVPAAGGEATFAQGRVRLVFSPGWNEQDAQVTFQLEELFRQQRRERGRLLLFTLSATAGGAPVESFDAPVAVTLAVGDLQSPDENDPAPTASTAPTPDEDWTPVESTFDPAAGTLGFTTTEMAAVQAATDPELWRLDYNPPGASAYSGSATYGYPIDLPPGIGGLTPDLSLSYSSRAAEGLTYPAMSQGFGAGWALPQAQINNGNAGNFYVDDADGTDNNKNYDANAFTLVLNGMNYYLNPLDTTGRYGTFKAIGAPELLIQYVPDGPDENDTDNVSGEFWRVRTADGTTYTFGKTEDAEQVVWPMQDTANRNNSQTRNQRFAPYNWKLNSIVDVHGNKVEYVYDTACGKVAGGTTDRGQNRQDTGHTNDFECSEVDTALSEIRYNFDGGVAKTVIRFTHEQVNDAVRSQKLSMTAGVFRPTQIKVIQNGNTNTPVSTYTFFYTGGSHGFTPWLVSTQFWMLTAIYHSGSDGTTLPAQQFSYSRNFTHGCSDDGSSCVKLLTQVDNGYGGVTVLGYQTYRDWEVVQYTETWDGVVRRRGTDGKGQTRVDYDHTGATACFDSAGSGCHMGTQQPSDALVGFNKATVKTQEWDGSAWKLLSKTETDFINANYLLLGKVSEQRQVDPDTSAVLVKDSYTWVDYFANDYHLAQLTSESHTLNPAGTLLKSSIDYTYYPLNPPAGSYGALKTKLEKDEANNAYRCTEYAYVSKTGSTWLINRPARETVWSGNCTGTPVAETLYRYAESDFPADTMLDDRGLLTHILRWDGAGYVRETRTYDARGLLKDVITFDATVVLGGGYTGTERNRTATTYTALGMPDTVTVSGVSATAETGTFEYDPARPWLVTQVTDANNLVTEYAYDGFGRLTKVAGPGDSLTAGDETVVYSYYDNGSLILLKPLVVGIVYKGNLRSAERQFYDGLGRLVQTQTAAVEVQGQTNDQDIIVTMAYDARGLEVCRTAAYGEDAYVYNGQTPFRGAACSTKSRTTTTYDALGRGRSVTTPDGATTETTYGVATNVTVDSHSRFLRTLIQDGNDHQTGRFSDVFGRLVMVREFTGTSNYTAYADTRYNYDAMDNLTAVRASAASDAAPANPLRVTTMDYDELGRKTTMNDADMGVWTYAYDPAGNLIRQKDSAGNVLCFTYDGLNRLLLRYQDVAAGEACPSGGPADGDVTLASYTYGATPGAHDIGKVKTVSWGPSPGQNNDTFTYDAEGRLKKQTRKVSGQSFAYEVTSYDTLNRPKQYKLFTGATAETIDIAYDHEGANTLTAGGTMLIDAVGYNERGQLAFLGRKETAQTPTVPDTTLSYYPAGEDAFRLSGIANGGAAAFPDFTYGGYDAAGNLTAFAAGSTGYGYSYDDLNRLKGVTGAIARTYTYDLLGNFDVVTRGGATWDYSYAAGNSTRLMGVTNLPLTVQSYDARGNLTKYTKSGVAYELTFDVENRLASVKVGTGQPTTFAYDADGQRVLATYPDGTKVYTPFPDYEVTDPPTGANVTRTTYRLGGQIAALRVNDGATNKLYYPLTDHLGNVMALSDVDGNFVSGSDARYDPFGAFTTTPATNPNVSNLGFTGHRHNNTGANNLGLIYMNARYYLPEVGRFVSPDTIVPQPGNPQSYNRYSYSLNNPIKYIDQDGHCPRPAESTSSVICMALFIEPSTVQAGPLTVHGDGRSFQSDSDPGASRGYIWIDIESGEWETHMNPSGYATPGHQFAPVPNSFVYFEPSESNVWDVSIDGNLITVSYDLVISGPLEWGPGIAPHINGVVQFTVNEDGTISFAFERDGFPWAEAYLYEGNQTEIIFRDPAVRGDPHDLFGIEPNIKFPASTVKWAQSLLRGEPQVSRWDGTWNGLYKPE